MQALLIDLFNNPESGPIMCRINAIIIVLSVKIRILVGALKCGLYPSEDLRKFFGKIHKIKQNQ